jgi:hypothetical protein
MTIYKNLTEQKFKQAWDKLVKKMNITDDDIPVLVDALKKKQTMKKKRKQ